MPQFLDLPDWKITIEYLNQLSMTYTHMINVVSISVFTVLKVTG